MDGPTGARRMHLILKKRCMQHTLLSGLQSSCSLNCYYTIVEQQGNLLYHASTYCIQLGLTMCGTHHQLGDGLSRAYEPQKLNSQSSKRTELTLHEYVVTARQ